MDDTTVAALDTGLAGTTVLILGLGASGLALARWCTRAGAAVRVWDSRVPAAGGSVSADASDGADARAGTRDGSTPAMPPNAAVLAADCPAAVLFGGDPAAGADGVGGDVLQAIDRVLKSPGLSPLDPRIAPLLQRARAAGIPVQGELDLFLQALAALRRQHDYAPKVVAITGTNGKTTTTALTALLAQRAGSTVAVAGNIGPTLLDTLTERLGNVGGALQPVAAPQPLPGVWVLELSSFQLDGVTGFDPDAATVLNVSQDHLDWHGTLAAYTAAKARVFGQHTLMVVNRDDAAVAAMVPPAVALATAARNKPRPAAARTVLRFGTDAPQHAGDLGIVTQNGLAWLVRALPNDETKARRVKVARAGAAPQDDDAQESGGASRGNDANDAGGGVEAVGAGIHLQLLMPADALRIRGRHNAANALAALALATAIGCPLAPMLHALRDYAGEPHRVQPIASIGGVEAWDDSKGTNVGATVAALEGLGADKAPARLVVILGGDGKGQDFAPLAAAVRRQVRAVATIGRDAPAIEAALADTGVPLQRHATLPQAVAWCFGQALPGDAVLLSPACASLDMFTGYAHRADVFAAAVRSLAADRGQA